MDKRRDKKGRVLNKGEVQRADGRYSYSFFDDKGERRYLYSWRLLYYDPTPAGKKEEKCLREMEEEIENCRRDGIIPYGGNCDVITLTRRYLELKRGVKKSTRQGYKTVLNWLENDPFGKRRIDLTFRNNTDSTIYIVAAVKQDSSNKKRLNATVAIYGLDMGDVRYEIESEITETLPAPFKPEYKKDTNGTYVTYKDQQKSVSSAKEGYVVNCYLVEYTSGEMTNRKLLHTDRYEAKAEVIYVGVKDR